MRRILALVTIALLLCTAAGCRHVGGACDCEHAINPSYKPGSLGPKSCGCGAPAAAPIPK